jgi:hypothetical protein
MLWISRLRFKTIRKRVEQLLHYFIACLPISLASCGPRTMRHVFCQRVLLLACVAVLGALGNVNRAGAAYVTATGRSPGTSEMKTTGLAPYGCCGADLDWAASEDTLPSDSSGGPNLADSRSPLWMLMQEGLRTQPSTGAPPSGSGTGGGLSAPYMGPVEGPHGQRDDSAECLRPERGARLPVSLASRFFRPPRLGA